MRRPAEKEKSMNNLHLEVERPPVKEAAAEALKPDGLDDEEWVLVREHRALRAEKERRVALWAQVIAELTEATGEDEDDWAAAGLRFIERAKACSWEDEQLEDFAIAFIEAIGFQRKEIRGRGVVWQFGRR
jgi:hypothetical protein